MNRASIVIFGAVALIFAGPALAWADPPVARLALTGGSADPGSVVFLDAAGSSGESFAWDAKYRSDDQDESLPVSPLVDSDGNLAFAAIRPYRPGEVLIVLIALGPISDDGKPEAVAIASVLIDVGRRPDPPAPRPPDDPVPGPIPTPQDSLDSLSRAAFEYGQTSPPSFRQTLPEVYRGVAIGVEQLRLTRSVDVGVEIKAARETATSNGERDRAAAVKKLADELTRATAGMVGPTPDGQYEAITDPAGYAAVLRKVASGILLGGANDGP